MSKVEDYRRRLRELDEWEPLLLAESGLPGPRGNIELAQAVAGEGNRPLFERYLRYTPDLAPANTPEEFLAFCGVLGLGRLLAEGEQDVLTALRRHAADSRWRVREAVAMALQRWGDADMAGLLAEMAAWSEGALLEQRAAAAALCEPRLLGDAATARTVLQILDQITATVLLRVRSGAARRSAPCARGSATAGAWPSSRSRKRVRRCWRSGWHPRTAISAGS